MAGAGRVGLEAALAQGRPDGSLSCFADRTGMMLQRELVATGPEAAKGSKLCSFMAGGEALR